MKKLNKMRIPKTTKNAVGKTVRLSKEERAAASAIGRAARVKGKKMIYQLTKYAGEQNLTRNQKATIEQMVNQTTRAIQETYIPREHRAQNKQLAGVIKGASNKINSMYEAAQLIKTEQGAANLFYQNQLNMASRLGRESNGEFDMLTAPTSMTSTQVSIFYKSTQNVWEGKPGNRNKAIMDYFGVDSLEEAFNMVMNDPRQQYAMGIANGEINQNTELTPEQLEYYEMENLNDNDQSSERYSSALAYVFKYTND